MAAYTKTGGFNANREEGIDFYRRRKNKQNDAINKANPTAPPLPTYGNTVAGRQQFLDDFLDEWATEGRRQRNDKIEEERKKALANATTASRTTVDSAIGFNPDAAIDAD